MKADPYTSMSRDNCKFKHIKTLLILSSGPTVHPELPEFSLQISGVFSVPVTRRNSRLYNIKKFLLMCESTRHRVWTMYLLTGRLLASFLGGKIREHVIVCPSREGKEKRNVVNSRAIGVPNVWAAVHIPSLGGACTALEHKQQQLFASSACSGWGIFLFGGEKLKSINPFFPPRFHHHWPKRKQSTKPAILFWILWKHVL